MNIYLAYKFTDTNKDLLRETLENISRNLESLGHTTFCFFRDIQEWGNVITSRAEIMPIAMENLDKCDILLMLVSSDEKSTGMGIEAGYAKARNKKILLIKKSFVEVAYLESISDNVIVYEEELPSVQVLENLLKL